MDSQPGTTKTEETISNYRVWWLAEPPDTALLDRAAHSVLLTDRVFLPEQYHGFPVFVERQVNYQQAAYNLGVEVLLSPGREQNFTQAIEPNEYSRLHKERDPDYNPIRFSLWGMPVIPNTFEKAVIGLTVVHIQTPASLWCVNVIYLYPPSVDCDITPASWFGPSVDVTDRQDWHPSHIARYGIPRWNN